MSDDLDLRGIDSRYEPNPQFRAALHRRVAAIVDGIDPDVVTAATRPGDDGPRTRKRQLCAESQPPPGCPSHPGRRCRRGDRARGEPRRRLDTSRPTGPDRDRAPDDASASAAHRPSDPELLAPGTYFVDEVDGTPTPRIFVTVGAGWSNFVDEGIGKNGPTPEKYSPEDDVGFITFSRPDKVYLDACHLSDGFYPGPVTTLDGLVTALREQRGWVDVTAPSDISIDGYPGKTFQRTVPAVLSDCPNFSPGHMRLPELDGNGLRSWRNENEENLGGYYYEPGQVETLVVLDIDGTVVVINANLWPGSSASDRAEFADVLDSIRIGSPDDAMPADRLTDRPTRRIRLARRGRTTSTGSTEHQRHGSRPLSTPGGTTWTPGRGWLTLPRGWPDEGGIGHHDVQQSRRRVLRRLPPDRRVLPGIRGNRRRIRHRAHGTAGRMGRRDRPVGHLHRRLRRQSIPTHGPRRHVGLHHQGRRARRWSGPFPTGRPQSESTGATRRARSRHCGSSTSMARSSSSAPNCGQGNRRRLTLISPTLCSTRSASNGLERRTGRCAVPRRPLAQPLLDWFEQRGLITFQTPGANNPRHRTQITRDRIDFL